MNDSPFWNPEKKVDVNVPFRLIANMFALYHTLPELDLVGTKEIDENLLWKPQKLIDISN